MKWKLVTASLAISFIIFAASYILMSTLANAHKQMAVSPVEFAQANPPVVEDFTVWCCYSGVNYVDVTVAWTLLIMLLCAVTIMLERCMTYSRARRQSLKFSGSPALYEALLDNSLGQAMRICAEYDRSHRARVVSAGLQAWQPARGAETLSVERSRRAMQNAAERQIEEFKRGLWMLKAIVWTAPLVALFGSLLNMIDMLEGMREAEGVLVAVVASDLATALEIASFGLAVAISTFSMHRFLQARVERLAADMEDSSWMVMDYCLKWQIEQAAIASSSETMRIEEDDSKTEGFKPQALWLYVR